ncbi:thiamin pyrophosphokinase, catalytic domain protein [Actinomyces denticolens]|nr:thiamin pyrophosphokinase, catalytic domain protein [Actinomyces denticolens]
MDAGIPLIDGLGADIMRLREGDRITVIDGAVRLEGEDAIVAEGTVQTPASVEASMESAKEGLAVQLEAFAANTMEYMKRERDLLLNGIGMPEIRTSMAGKHVLVVVRGYSYKEDLKALRSYIRDCKPVIIGVDGGADAVIEAGFKPTMIVGDMDSVSDKALRSGAEIVVHAYRDGRAPGLARVEALGVDHVVFSATGTSEDIAMLMADEADAELIVALGTHATLLEFLDKGRAGMSSTFLTRLKVGGRLIDAKGVSRLYRTRISSWHLFFLALAGLLALWAALQSTPAGQTVLSLFGAIWDDFINFLRSLVGLSPRTPSL